MSVSSAAIALVGISNALIDMRVSAASAKIQNPICMSLSPAGGNHDSTKNAAVGSAEPKMKGCRRPMRDRVMSDQRPMNGSAKASTSSVSAIAPETIAAGTPSTWL